MYGIYNQNHHDVQPQLIAICHTKLGAKHSCAHYSRVYARETGRALCQIKYNYIDSYWMFKFGYFLLCLTRKIETRKLHRLESEERKASSLRLAQEKKLASLY